MANTTDKSILTAAGKALLAQLNAEEKPLIIDKMIFANVPNRPEFPQPDDVVPTDHVVHQEGVEQRGRLSADSVIYSTTLTSDVGPFEFNWTGAYCSEYGVLVTIDHHALTPKSADEPGVAGNTLVRSVVLEYKDIAEITNITVDASSWQYNATPRMKKMDDDVAQAIIDQNGKDWFIKDGFLVTPQASAFNIKAGAGYVSGNRVMLEFDRNVQVPNKPSFIYVDAHREGTPTGEQVTLFDFVVTADDKDDYADANGVNHFVCKIAQVLGDGSVSDLRPEGESATKTYVEKNSEQRQKASSSGTKQLDIKTGYFGQDATGTDRVYLDETSYWHAWDEPQGIVTNFVDNNDYGTATMTTTVGSYEFVKPDIYSKRIDFWPSAWGVRAKGGHDDWLGWHRLMEYYKSKAIVHVEPGMTPLASIPLIKGIVGRTLLSKPLELFGYFKADLDLTNFGRHPDWNEPEGTYLLTSKDMYQADFGGLSIYNEDYVLNVENDNSDNALIRVDNLRFSKCNHALRSFCQSANVEYSDFRFDNCKRMVDIVRGDKVIFRRGNMYQAPLTEQWDCSIDNRNAKLIIRDVLGVPAKHTASEVAWINNSDGGRVDVDSDRFGGENGGGCATVNNFAKFKLPTDDDPTPVSIKIRNSDVYSVDTQGGKQKSCIVRLFEMPNILHFTSNEGMVMTEEVITFGKSVVNPTSKVDEVIEKLSNFSFRYNHNSHDREIRKYPEEMIDLFMPSDTFPLVAKPSGTDGLANCDTRIKPNNSSVFDISVTGQVFPSSSPHYQSSYHCRLTIGTVYEGGNLVRKATITEVAKSPGGSSSDKQLIVKARFWDGIVQSETADILEDKWRLRVQVEGFEDGHEGAGFKGTIRQLI
ncbi:phage tail protein [Vibrio parahaemolyticus]|uniref:phage tail-collar fiber domain-containing protein n=1 Tax=Vibrio parahaemolyticus TaxID=670 RepID=UPI001EEA645B|nr:phage tail protein [Vibrio parahaemolyticus]EIJ0972616.1 phage tail protein [Vibrio parahaemolyticus]MCG6484660.1 phage tail protein [Vibrio parahaemolyticus]